MPNSIMVVEDDPDTREMYCQALESDYRVVSAGSGQQALELLTNEYPDMLILDVSLPDMSGLDFIKRMRAEPARQKLKVLMVSGWQDIGSMAEKAGAFGYLRKPFDLLVLLETVRQTLVAPPASDFIKDFTAGCIGSEDH
jgi:two-component system cell cycle response regulator